MPRKKQRELVERHVALCYVRQSYTRDGNDMTSPERQRANIEAVCAKNGWLAEWYQDAEGHKSGRTETNRPGWLALKKRLGDPDVVALVANDLARLHRKGWRVGDLLDFIEEHEVTLVLASPSSPIADLSSLQGRMMMQIAAMFDEWYAADLSQRQKDSIAYRRGRGKVIGITPFGTMRDKEGYLMPSIKGAWYMPDGSFQAGTVDSMPDPAAMWRSYYECAERILTLYSENQVGVEAVAYQMQIEGWPFRDRNSIPRRIERDDVRRVVAGWPAYGGIVLTKMAKDRPGYDQMNADEIPFNAERAVFDLNLLRRVAAVRRERSIRPANDGVRQDAHVYALHGLVYCAHCERLAAQQNNPRLCSVLTGSAKYGKMRYRHKESVKCGCINRSVPSDIIEDDFARLIQLLTIREDAANLMIEIAVRADKLRRPSNELSDLETEKREAIAQCKRRIDAAVYLFGDGRIERDEYLRRIEQNEREIAHWESRTTETEKAALELTMCVEAISKLARLWEMGEQEDRQGMARTLFSYITYDIDTRRIVDFRLKPWADRFLILRADLYSDDDQGSEPQNKIAPTNQGMERAVPLQGSKVMMFLTPFWTSFSYSLN
jgi:DNA invertase Pin-like site-specific DNA recombinase